jgi:tight adherence protein C
MSRLLIMSPAALAALALATLARQLVPPQPVRVREMVAPAAPQPSRRSSVVTTLGAVTRRRLGRPPDERADRSTGWAVVATALLLMVIPPLAALWAVGFCVGSILRRRRAEVRHELDLVAELPEVVDLLSLAVAAGLTIPPAVGVVASRGRGRLAAELARARRSAELGSSLADALDDIPARLGDPVRPITRVLSGSLRDGTSIGEALERVAGEVRTARRRAAEERARRVSVRLLFPLVCCVLPAFALLTVVPLLAGALRGISL